MMLRFLGLCFCVLLTKAFAWNNTGHKLAARIAYNHLSTETRAKVNRINHALDNIYPVQSFVNAAAWLDNIRYRDVRWYDRMHYVDWPFSREGKRLPPIESVNALWAIEKALIALQGKYAKPFDKGVALRVLIHVIADLHQPLHATTLVTDEHPEGDAGGNLFPIRGGVLGKNLHSYWDKGGGFLLIKNSSRSTIRKKAAEISQHWPCEIIKSDFNPKLWLEESHQLGMNQAYNISPATKPDYRYQKTVQTIAEQRIAEAGCRIADLLNNQQRGKPHGRYN